MSSRTSIKRHYLKTKAALNRTIQAILDINRKRRATRDGGRLNESINEELRVLNAVAENQALRLRHYEQQMSQAQQETAA